MNTFVLENKKMKLQPSLDVDGFNLKKYTILCNYKHLFTYKTLYFSSNSDFNPYMVEITEISTDQVIAIGYADHHERMYKFSSFLPTSNDQALLSHANEVSKLWHQIFGHMNYKYL